MSDRRIVQTSQAPAAIGPYSQGIVSGGFVHCSGQIAIDPATGGFGAGDLVQQAERALANLRAVVEAAGSSLDQVVKCTVFLTDMRDFQAFNEVYARCFAGPKPPARSTVAVAGLPKGARVEVDCVARIG